MANRYFIGTGNWSDIAHWSSSSGGVSGSTVPTLNDNVFLDTNSGNVTIDTNVGSVNCFNLNCSGFTGSLYGAAQAYGIYIYSNLLLSPTMLITQTVGLAISFLGNATGRTITTAGQTLSYFLVNMTGGDITLLDDVSLNQYWKFGYGGASYFAGNVNASNRTINITGQTFGYSVVYTGTTLNMTNTTLNLNCGNVTPAAAFSPNMNVITSGSTINMSLTTYKTFDGGGHVFNVISDFVNSNTYADTLTFSNSIINTLNCTKASLLTFNTGVTIGSFNYTPPKLATNQITLGSNINITNNLTISGGTDNRYRILITSDTIGTQRNISYSGTTNTKRIDFRDIKMIPSIDLSGIVGGAGDCLGNTGITFNPSRNMYWKTTTIGTKYWSNYDGSNPWFSLTNGSGVSYTDSPLPQDNVYFDGNSIASGSVGSSTIMLDVVRSGKDISWSGVTSTPIWNQGNIFTMYGSLAMVNGMTITNNGMTFNFEGRSTHNVTSGGKILNTIFFNAVNGSYTLLDNFIIDYFITFFSGTFNANNFNLTVNGYGFNINGATVNMGNGTWKNNRTNLNGTLFNFSSGALNCNQSTLELAGNITGIGFNAIGNTSVPIILNNLKISGIASSGAHFLVNANITIVGTFTIITPNSVHVVGGQTLTLGPSANISAIGTPGSFITLSGTTTTPWIITQPTGNTIFNCDYLNLSYSTAAQTNKFYAGANSINLTGNTNWVFSTYGLSSDTNPNYYDGNISNIQIYSRALSQTEIIRNFNNLKKRYM